jgi:uncharacterized protein (DUF608 family)
MSTTTKSPNQSSSGGDPWTYRGTKLKHMDFPLGGIGTGTILLQGDGCLRGWNVQNQFGSAEHRPLHNLPPLNGIAGADHCNSWAISACYDDDHEEEEEENETKAKKSPRPSFLLRSANHHGIREKSGCSETINGKTGSGPALNHLRTEGRPRSPLDATSNNDNSIKTKNSHRPPDVPELSVRARYPIAVVSYETPPSFPLSNIELEATTPLVPTDARASGTPLAVFSISLSNPHPTRSVSVDVMQSTLNFIGWDGGTCTDGAGNDDKLESGGAASTAGGQQLPSCLWGGNLNEPFVHSASPPSPPSSIAEAVSNSNSNSPSHSCQGLFLHSKNDLKQDLTRKGSIALSAICRTTKTATNCGSDVHPVPKVRIIKGVGSEDELFERFASRDFEEIDPDGQPTDPSPEGTTYACAVVQSFDTIPPRSTARATFVLSWHFPYRPCTAKRANLPPDFYGNLYASWFADARDVATKFCDALDGKGNTPPSTTISKPRPKNPLEVTRLLVDVLYGSTIPWEILESAAGRLAIPRSPTIFRTEAGIVLGNACNEKGPLNGTHWYGYTTLLECVFPVLAKDMLTSAFVRNFDLKAGGCQVSYGIGGFAIDGALACVIKVYLVVLRSDPALDFLKTVWPNVKRQMEAILENKLQHLNARDGVIEGPQQTTYGGPMNGANTLVGSYLVTALKATQAMANLMGDVNFARKCSKQAEESTRGYEDRCWSEEFGYYLADVDQTNCQNSYGKGCCLDQLAAVGLSRACGFGCVFDDTREATARRAIVHHNRVSHPPFRDADEHLCYGDSGLRVCTYPHGRLGDAMPASDRVASGLEYSLVAGLIGDGNWEDAIRICSSIRDRQSGIHRSPWNEPESSGYSSRSMSGWNLLEQACGFSYDSTRAGIGFSPAISAESFSCFFVFHNGFGEFQQQTTTNAKPATAAASPGDGKFSSGTISFRVLYGSIELKTMHLDTTANSVVASLDGQGVKASIGADGVVAFDTKIAVGEDSTLTLTLSSSSSTAKRISDRKADSSKVRLQISSLSINRTDLFSTSRRSKIRSIGMLFLGFSILFWWVFSLPSLLPTPISSITANFESND